LCAALNPNSKKILTQVLKEARERIQVDDDELTEARRRRGLIAAALLREFGRDARTYVNGSIAHGDALTPLTDIDLGIVIPDPDGEYGPHANGPGKLQARSADAIRRELKGEFPRLRVYTEDRKRAVYVVFGAPVDPNEDDFTADVIVALDHPSGVGLWIPLYETWDRSHPEGHTKLVRDAVRSSNVNYSRTVRLLKHWARKHSHPLCSWHIKALALAVLDVSMDQLVGMLAWFDYAIADLGVRDTPDPAGVTGPIVASIPRTELVEKLTKARGKLAEAIEFDQAGYGTLAVEALATFFNDDEMLPHPDPVEVAKQASQRSFDLRKARSARTSPMAATQVRHRTPVRSWAP